MFDDNINYALDAQYLPEYDKLPRGNITPFIFPQIENVNTKHMDHLKKIRIGRLEKLAKYLREENLKFDFNFGIIYRWNVRSQTFEGDAIAHAVDLFPHVLKLVPVDKKGYYMNVVLVGEKGFLSDRLNQALTSAQECFGLTDTLTGALFIPYMQQSQFVKDFYPGLELRMLKESSGPIEVADNITSVCRYVKNWKKNNQ